VLTIESDDEQTDGQAIAYSVLSIMLLRTKKSDKLTVGNVNRPLDLDDNFNVSLNYIEKSYTSHESWRGPSGIGPTALNRVVALFTDLNLY